MNWQLMTLSLQGRLKVKTEVVQGIILGIERLLPDTCGSCSMEYVIDRETTPSLLCKGCNQGFHQPCLEKLLDGKVNFPLLPGSLWWLCDKCSPYYQLVTTVGQGGRSRPTRSRAVTCPPISGACESDLPPIQAHPTIQETSPLVRCGLPFLWGTEWTTTPLSPPESSLTLTRSGSNY